MKWARVGWGGQNWSGPFPLGALHLNQHLSPAESKMSHIRTWPELTQRSQCTLHKESMLLLFSISNVPTTLNNTDNQQLWNRSNDGKIFQILQGQRHKITNLSQMKFPPLILLNGRLKSSKLNFLPLKDVMTLKFHNGSLPNFFCCLQAGSERWG